MTEPTPGTTHPATAAVEALVARVADEFEERRARGERPDPEEYAARHPEAAGVIREVLAVFGLLGASHTPPDSPPGTAAVGPGVLGDYRIVREVGRGGMGVVYEAEQISLGRRVALKVLPFGAVMDPRHLRRFRNEALAAAGLDHPHVVKVHGVGCERGVHFIAMQFIDGRPLSELIRERRGEPISTVPAGREHATTTAVTLPAPPRSSAVAGSRTPADAAYVRRVAEWGVHAAEALEHAHGLGVVHRDVKPGNLLIDGRGEVYVADFGLAKLAGDPGVTGTGDVLGTVRYMSPEQAEARHDLVDHRSDVYSLGVTLYELLTLTPAFDGKDRQEVLSRVTGSEPVPPRLFDRRIPRDLETVILKAMEKEPSRRYRSARELADDLKRFLNNEPVRAKRPGILDRVGKWAKRNRGVVAATAAGLVLAAAVLAGAVGWVTRDAAARRERTERVVEPAYREAIRQCGLMRWPEALAAAREAEGLLAGGDAPSGLADEVRRLRASLELVARLESARFEMTEVREGTLDQRAADAAYAETFASAGLDIDALPPEDVAARVPPEVGVAVGSVLGEWAVTRRIAHGPADRGWER